MHDEDVKFSVLKQRCKYTHERYKKRKVQGRKPNDRETYSFVQFLSRNDRVVTILFERTLMQNDQNEL